MSQLLQIATLRWLVQRQLTERLIDGEPLAIATDRARVLPFDQLLGDGHHKHLGAMLVIGGRRVAGIRFGFRRFRCRCDCDDVVRARFGRWCVGWRRLCGWRRVGRCCRRRRRCSERRIVGGILGDGCWYMFGFLGPLQRFIGAIVAVVVLRVVVLLFLLWLVAAFDVLRRRQRRRMVREMPAAALVAHLERAQAAAQRADDAGLFEHLANSRHGWLLVRLDAAARHDPQFRSTRRRHQQHLVQKWNGETK